MLHVPTYVVVVVIQGEYTLAVSEPVLNDEELEKVLEPILQEYLEHGNSAEVEVRLYHRQHRLHHTQNIFIIYYYSILLILFWPLICFLNIFIIWHFYVVLSYCCPITVQL